MKRWGNTAAVTFQGLLLVGRLAWTGLRPRSTLGNSCHYFAACWYLFGEWPKVATLTDSASPGPPRGTMVRPDAYVAVNFAIL